MSLLPLLGATALAAVLSLSGCGTFSDAMCGPIDNHTCYRGVRLDLKAASEGGWHAFLLTDLPFSAIADTCLLPGAILREKREQRGPESEKQVSNASGN